MSDASRLIKTRSTLAAQWIRSRCGVQQVALFAALYFAYEAGRALTVGSFDGAVAHGQAILALEGHVGLASEHTIQRALIDTPLAAALSAVYLAAQLVVLPGALAWTYRRDRRIYRTLRDTVIATWALALPVYALFPTAPPRLADVGLADVVSGHAVSLDANFSTILYNPIAAMPSLHAGFAFAIGLAVFYAARTVPGRVVGLAWGPLVVLSVIATGNHYTLDVLAGLVATAAGFTLATIVARARHGVRSHRRSGEPVDARGVLSV